MNGKVLDSNFILDYLKGEPNHVAFMEKYIHHPLWVSIITEIELFSFSEITEAEKAVLHSFFAFVKVIPINDQVKDAAISFRKETHRKLPDSIIAATAISLAAELVTSDKTLLKSSFPNFTAIKP